jgi:hypothetical protein
MARKLITRELSDLMDNLGFSPGTVIPVFGQGPGRHRIGHVTGVWRGTSGELEIVIEQDPGLDLPRFPERP